jgi:hypothetical protein
VLVFCSIIHLNSALVFAHAQDDLWNTGLPLDVHFNISSSEGVRLFENATRENIPSLVTVTEGTANLLEQKNLEGGKKYWKFLEVQPGLLHWSNPRTEESFSIAKQGVENLTFIYHDHPTDDLAFREFSTTLSKKLGLDIDKIHLKSRKINNVPERIDLYDNTSKKEFLLTNSFLDTWVLMGKSPSIIRGWEITQRRFIFANQPLIELGDNKGYPVVYWLQEYLAYLFENLFKVNHEFRTSLAKLGSSNLLKKGLQYIGVTS